MPPAPAPANHHPAPRRRPVHLDLRRIAQPVGAWTSILHRASGVVLVAGIPLLAWALERSLASPAGFAQLAAALARAPVQALVLAWIWALAHHVLAGVRHLLSDVDVGAHLGAARRSAWAVNLAALALTLLAAAVLR